MGINIQAIKASFELVKPRASIVADRFYEVLFQDFPESKEIFSRVDMLKQKNALISALAQAVGNLDKPDSLTKFLLNLGENHGRYGVQDIHYEWVGQSLIKALRQSLADAWTPDLEYNWTQVYGIIAEAMKAGAKRTKSNVRPLYPDSPAEKPIEKQMEMQVEKQLEKHADATPKEHLAIEPSLTLSLAAKNQIRHLVDRAFEDLIKKEVSICIEENMQNIEKMSISDLVKKAV